MNTESVNRCPKCQTIVPPEAPQGLCPQCLLSSAATPTEAGPSVETPPPTLEAVAAAFPQLEIVEFVGQGGMGLVYKARQPKLDRLVALKLLPARAGADPTFGERFNREARVLARLSHPNIVAVHDFGQAGPFYYLLMEFVDGVNLRQAMRAGRFTPAQALVLVPKICDALQYAHEEGVLHRDIKPENLLLDSRGRIKIADFGIAKLQGEARDVTLTASGAAVGTPHYMAPEQLEHPKDVDQRADIYSLGVVFYELLTGELPLGRFAPPSEKSTVDARIDEIVMRTLEKERDRRFQTAGEVGTRIEHVTSHPAPGGGSSGTNPALSPAAAARTEPTPAGPSRWCTRAITAAVLVAVSLFMTPMIVIMPGHFSSPQGWFWMVFIDLWAVSGAALGWSALSAIRKANGQLRGWRLALFAVVAYLIPVSPTVLGIGFALLQHGPFRFFAPPTALFAWVAFLALNGLALFRWLRGEPPDRFIFSATRALGALKRRPLLWIPVAVLSFLVFIVLLFITVHGLPYHQSFAPPSTTTMLEPPDPPPGYEVTPGLPPGNDREFQSALTIPAGYALTIVATLSSNQVVLRRNGPAATAFVIAPPSQSAEATLKWRFLGNTTLADGAPLQFVLAATPEGEGSRTNFLFTPPVPLSIDWVSEPAQIWPPQNGHTKFLLAKGKASAPEPMVESPPPAGPGPLPVAPFNTPMAAAAEWAVGIEIRLDPLPTSMASMDRTRVGAGTNWSLALSPKPAASPLDPETTETAPPKTSAPEPPSIPQ